MRQLRFVYYQFAPGKSRRTQAWMIAGSLVASLCTGACTGEVSLGETKSDGSCRFLESTAETVPISAGTFWRESPDAEGFEYLEGRASDRGGRVTVTYYKNRQELLTGLQTSPVDVFQVNGGSDVLQFALDSSLPGVCALDALDDVLDIRRNYFRASWEPMSCNGFIYSLPLNVHRLNTVMVNLAVYDELQTLAQDEGVDVPDFPDLPDGESLLSVLELARELPLPSSTSSPLVPASLCIGSTAGDAWPLPIVAFENFLASYEDGAYEAIWEGKTGLSRDDKEEALRRLVADLRRFRDVSHLGPDFDRSCPSEISLDIPEAHSWQRAAELVRTGEALLTIGGDWLRGQIPEEERDTIMTYPFPGQEGTFAYTPDTFAVQYRPDTDGAAARLWLTEVLAEPETQVGFARQKQAIPAHSRLTDSEISSLRSEYLIENYRTFRACHEEGSPCRLLLAVSGLAPAAGTDECFDRLGLLVAASVGVEYTDEEWIAFERGCDRRKPQTPDEAEDALIDLLLQVSESPFAGTCRN